MLGVPIILFIITDLKFPLFPIIQCFIHQILSLVADQGCQSACSTDPALRWTRSSIPGNFQGRSVNSSEDALVKILNGLVVGILIIISPLLRTLSKKIATTVNWNLKVIILEERTKDLCKILCREPVFLACVDLFYCILTDLWLCPNICLNPVFEYSCLVMNILTWPLYESNDAAI